MKKLIAIAVVFALAAGAAFAEIKLTGGVETKVKVAYSDKGQVVKSGDVGGDVTLEGSATNEEGTFGFGLKFYGSADTNSNSKVQGNVWWQPIKYFKLLLSNGSGGGWDHGGIGVYDDDGYQGGGTPAKPYKLPDVAPGGFGSAKGNAHLTVKPLDTLEIDFGLPFGVTFENNWEYIDMIRGARARLLFTVPDVGVLGISYKGVAGPSSLGSLFMSFELKAVPKVPVMLSFGYKLPKIETYDAGIISTLDPLGIGLKVGRVALGDLGLRFRAQMGFFGGTVSTTSGSADFDPTPVTLMFDFTPDYNFTDKVNLQLGVGVGVLAAKVDSAGNVVANSAKVTWNVSSRLLVKVSSGGNLLVGFYVQQVDPQGNAPSVAPLSWGIPVGLKWSF